MIKITSNINELERDLRNYAQVARKSMSEVLRKKGKDLAFALNKRFRALSPPKGFLKDSDARLRDWGGISIRDSVRARVNAKFRARTDLATRKTVGYRIGRRTGRELRRVNLQQEYVKSELRQRERSRGYLALSAIFPGIQGIHSGSIIKAFNRRKTLGLSQAAYADSGDNQTLSMEWGRVSEASAGLASELNSPGGQEAINSAINDVRSDIHGYLKRKFDQTLAQSFR